MLQVLRKIAFPISLIYAFVVFIRNRMFDWGLFSSKSYDTPTICIGNLSVGGTGKTPMIEYLIKLMDTSKIAVLSRGYKRKSKGFLLAGPESTVQDLGDEPYQMHRKFPKIAVAVDVDRQNGIEKLEGSVQPEIILLDDAFQHRRVRPNYSILLTAYGNLFVNDWYLPTGNLRDSKAEVKRADIIIVTKCPILLSDGEKNSISKKINPRSNQKVLFATLSYAGYIQNDSGKINLLELKGKNFALVTGIASPKPLVAHLRSLGLTFEHFNHGDHHYFSDNEIEKFRNFEIIMTTEKDYTRLNGRLENLFYLEVAHSFMADDGKTLKQAIIGQI